MTAGARIPTTLWRLLEGAVADLPPHERRDLYRRQILALHGPLSNLLLVLAVVQFLHGLIWLLWADEAMYSVAWRLAAGLLLVALALRFRALESVRRRRQVGLLFLAVVLACLVTPGSGWQQLPLAYLAGVLLLPLAGLPLLVRPGVAWSGLGLCTLAVAAILWQVQATPGERLAFAFYFAMSACAGLVLRRARANLAVRLDREVESLWQRATRDLLTGLLNRHGWLGLANASLSDAVAAGRQAAVLFLDVDHFKRTNDTHGHLVGDELLRRLGQLVQSRLGPRDLAARLGGEEFACLLPDGDRARAGALAQRLARDYRELASEYGSTLSIGIALYQQGDLLNDLLARADAALYQAKREGRDRVVFADD
ncbi:diguanylate cyclase [Arenimonas fontis]|nr:GGDEF domain-containing protein [Arenimonas fontis]